MTGAALSFTSVVCRYGRRTVIDEVGLEVQPGEHVALTGANGSGKTTLLRAALGLHPLAGGEVSVDGKPARTPADWNRRRQEIAWVPQRLTPGRFPLRVGELLDSAGSGEGAAGAREAASDLGVGTLERRPLHTLSGGQLQRTFLARALGCVRAGANALFADEPTAALDFAGQEQVAAVLAGLPVTVVVVSHDHAMSSACHRIVEMAAGHLREVR